MRVKTSISISPEALRIVDRLAGKHGNRSQVIEAAIREYARQRVRSERDRRDVEILEANAEYYQREALDALEYQGLP